jgi:hypothetical protein
MKRGLRAMVVVGTIVGILSFSHKNMALLSVT